MPVGPHRATPAVMYYRVPACRVVRVFSRGRESEVRQGGRRSYRSAGRYMCNCGGSSVCRAAAARTAPRSAPAYAAMPPRPQPRASPSSRRRLRRPQAHSHCRWPGYNTCRPLRATSAPTYEGGASEAAPARVCALVPLVHTRRCVRTCCAADVPRKRCQHIPSRGGGGCRPAIAACTSMHRSVHRKTRRSPAKALGGACTLRHSAFC